MNFTLENVIIVKTKSKINKINKMFSDNYNLAQWIKNIYKKNCHQNFPKLYDWYKADVLSDIRQIIKLIEMYRH
jgi:hypothetical protein